MESEGERNCRAHSRIIIEAANCEGPLSYLFMTVRQDTNATALIERLHTSERIRKMSQARVVTPRAELPGEALIGESCLYFVPDNPDMPLHTDDIALGGLDLAMAGGTAWRLEDIRELHRRRYQLQERAIEIFLVTGRTYLLAFNSSKSKLKDTSVVAQSEQSIKDQIYAFPQVLSALLPQFNATRSNKELAPGATVVKDVAMPKWKISTPTSVSKHSIASRTRHVLNSIATAESAASRWRRIEDLLTHIEQYPESRHYAIKEGAVTVLLRARTKTKDPQINGL